MVSDTEIQLVTYNEDKSKDVYLHFYTSYSSCSDLAKEVYSMESRN